MTAKSSFNEKLNIPPKNIFQRFEFSRQKKLKYRLPDSKVNFDEKLPKKKSLETDEKRKEVRFNFIATKDSGKNSTRKLQI